jgi:hypothetical protein
MKSAVILVALLLFGHVRLYTSERSPHPAEGLELLDDLPTEPSKRQTAEQMLAEAEAATFIPKVIRDVIDFDEEDDERALARVQAKTKAKEEAREAAADKKRVNDKATRETEKKQKNLEEDMKQTEIGLKELSKRDTIRVSPPRIQSDLQKESIDEQIAKETAEALAKKSKSTRRQQSLDGIPTSTSKEPKARLEGTPIDVTILTPDLTEEDKKRREEWLKRNDGTGEYDTTVKSVLNPDIDADISDTRRAQIQESQLENTQNEEALPTSDGDRDSILEDEVDLAMKNAMEKKMNDAKAAAERKAEAERLATKIEQETARKKQEEADRLKKEQEAA